MPEEEKKDLFFKLRQAAYGFVGEDWPQMDKNHFEVRPLLKCEIHLGKLGDRIFVVVGGGEGNSAKPNFLPLRLILKKHLWSSLPRPF